ncbi:diacylglycerol/polyprenol kinase family protein [Leptolyngbya sp. Cla-17]|uniref:diacylglycerol/polyprenol kinase family protein n=1 Tax=Leptolyngbya sp. Cla-17 TaxID=2803751 RepID=UPI0018D66D6B|nr:diacylglycerol/polyprenol kinase family protein [Leptolyngbya sp. Cla-17]
MTISSWWVVPVPLWLQLGLVGTWLGLVGLSAEWLYRTKLASPEVVRKVVHIGVGNVILLAWWLQAPAWLGIGASIAFSAIAFLSYQFPILPSINGVGRKSLGTFFYAVSIGLLISYFWTIEQREYAVLGVLVMTWGDGLAALIGQRFGKHLYTLWDTQKSWEGSLTMAIASFVVSSSILVSVQGNIWQSWIISVAVALWATGLEAFSKFGIDNLTVPVGSAAIAFLLGSLLFLE